MLLFSVAAFSNIIPNKNKDIHSMVFMFWAGIGTAALSFLAPVISGVDMELITEPAAIGIRTYSLNY